MMKQLLKIAFEWGVRSFGVEHMMNFAVRALRVVEEAIELCQAHGVPEETVHECVRMVYSNPVGEPDQEMGGVLLTSYALCAAKGQDPTDVFTTELCRVLNKPPKYYADRNDKKVALGMDVPAASLRRNGEPDNDCQQDEGA